MLHTLFADGGSRGNPGPAASGAVICDASHQPIAKVGLFLGVATNNQAEYSALIIGLTKASKLGIKRIAIRLDSKLVVEQVSGRWKVKDEKIKKLLPRIHTLLKEFTHYDIRHIPRAQNSLADSIVNNVLDRHT